jgi:hypothetical protein
MEGIHTVCNSVLSLSYMEVDVFRFPHSSTTADCLITSEGNARTFVVGMPGNARLRSECFELKDVELQTSEKCYIATLPSIKIPYFPSLCPENVLFRRCVS